MDCPQCHRECGQNEKSCSECGYKLCSANTPVTGSNRHTHSKRRSHTDNRLLGCCRAFICCQCSAQDEEETSLLESENEQTDTTPAEHTPPGTPAADSEYQEETTDNRSSLGPEPAPEDPSSCLAQSQPSSADPAKSDAESGLADTDDMDGTLSKHTKHTVCTAHAEMEETLEEQKEKYESQTSLLESENQKKDTTAPEHITPGTPAPDSEHQEETTDNRSSLGPEPVPENPSLCLAQSQPSSADPAKSDAKSGLADTDSMDGTLREDTKYTVCTAQEEEEEDEEVEEEEEEEETEDSKDSVSVSKDETVSTDSDQQEGPEHPISESQAHSDNHTHNDNQTHSKSQSHTHSEDHTLSKSQSHTHSDDHTHSQSLGPPDTGSPEDEAKEAEDSKESVSVSKGETISKVSHAMPSPRRTSGASLPGGDLADHPHTVLRSSKQKKNKKISITAQRGGHVVAPQIEGCYVMGDFTVNINKGPDVKDCDQQERYPISKSDTHSDNHTHCGDHTHSQSQGQSDTGLPKAKTEETLKEQKEKDKSQTSLLKSENQQKDTTPAEHITPDTPAPEPSAPGRVEANDVKSRSVTLCWERPVSMEGVSHEIHITYSCEGEEPRSQICAPNTTRAVLSDLRPGMKYTFNITAVLPNGICSRTSSTCLHTRTSLDELVCDLGLEDHLKNKLTLSKVLEIDGETLSDESIQSLKSLPWCFLRRLMMVNVTARSVRCATKQDTTSQNLGSLLNTLSNPQDHSNIINPLDLITAVFLCSDGFLQQEMVLKMSMCQYSVPLLLPECDTQQCTLMLWAMRDIVKKYKPHSLEDQRGFVEESIVVSKLPMISFVRLGDSSLSKSHILNQLLSSPQEHHETFVHRNIKCGNTPRRISNGLVEISWYLPCGNIDIFSEPLVIANLRGDLRDFETQYAFLCHNSAAVFVFCDDFRFDYKILDSKQLQAHLYLIINSQSKSFNKDDFRRSVSELKLRPCNIIIRGPQMNDAEFIRTLRLGISGILKGNMMKMSIEQMSDVAHEVGIQVDEDYIYCQRGKQKADEITGGISDIQSFKEKELPMQGTAWKQVAKLEREECRMKHAGEKNIEVYRNELTDLRQKLRAQQRANNISESMSRFISAISGSTEECKYFLKWMRINLDNLSRKSLPLLRAEYKEQCQNSWENKELIGELDRKISSSSLGMEHFLREMGQLYESACSHPKGLTSEIQRLPRLAAELLQEGFPLELVDGDASNIPLQWVTQVLKEFHQLTQYKSKIRVVTVLGVQGTGKSTLLNTMFGVQFAVSSGKCTRGAFMLLIRVKEDFKEQLGCDYIMVIDTEGLKSPELTQLDDSYEHDNELATVVVGLSDITVINIAIAFTEMKDILQIVVHAFLRMTEVGRKPCCHFVHQNVPDISAQDNKLRSRKLLDQLNEITQVAAKMEKKLNIQKFTDVMEYDPERNTWYIPGLWDGIPPMAPVNAGYSESVNLLQRSVIEHFKEHKSGKNSPHTFIEFLEWTWSLWSTVKYENFIFSFRNSVVADAYTQLCTEFNKLEWEFRKNMYSWLRHSETRVSNFGTIAAQIQPFSNLNDLLSSLKSEASLELTKGEKLILDNLAEFYKRSDGHVHLVEKYKQEFINTAKTIRMETENSVKNRLDATVEIREGMFRLEKIKKNHTAVMEQKVFYLIEKCRKSKDLSDQELETEFEKMWKVTVAELWFPGLEKHDIAQDIFHQLRGNLEREGSSVHEMLSKVGNLYDCGKNPFIVKQKSQAFLMTMQQMADHIIMCSRQFVDEKVRTRSDYHNTYMMDLLRMVDENLDRHRHLGTSAEVQASLKIHICGHAAREFQKMHLDFIHTNDPRRCLEQFKEQYCADFKDLFSKRDQCQKKAEEFTYNCLAPAVKEYISRCLGPDLVDDVLTGRKNIYFSTRSFFQFSILKQLLLGDNFKDFVNYIRNYESFVQDWIFEQMVKQFSEGDGLRNIEIKHLKVMVKRLKEAIENAGMKANEGTSEMDEEDQNIKQFIQDICSDLQELVIPKDPLKVVLALNTPKPEDFSWCLKVLVDEMEQSFTAEFQRGGDVRARLTSLPFQPQKELFNRVFGCGKQCPSCKTPCEAGGKNHTEHFASIHRPWGISGHKDNVSCKLLINICCPSVAIGRTFMSSETLGKWHPYKDYQSIYTDWVIQPDTSIQASFYWKYVFNRFNEQFAKEFDAKPADIPPLWRDITQDQAMKNLKESFQMITGD